MRRMRRRRRRSQTRPMRLVRKAKRPLRSRMRRRRTKRTPLIRKIKRLLRSRTRRRMSPPSRRATRTIAPSSNRPSAMRRTLGRRRTSRTIPPVQRVNARARRTAMRMRKPPKDASPPRKTRRHPPSTRRRKRPNLVNRSAAKSSVHNSKRDCERSICPPALQRDLNGLFGGADGVGTSHPITLRGPCLRTLCDRPASRRLAVAAGPGRHGHDL